MAAMSLCLDHNFNGEIYETHCVKQKETGQIHANEKMRKEAKKKKRKNMKYP